MGEIVEFRFLYLLAKVSRIGEAMQQRGHRPGEANRLPDTFQGALGIGVQTGVGFLSVMLQQSGDEVVHIGRRQIEALGTRRRYDMGGVAHQEQSAEPHRLSNERAQRRNGFFKARACDHGLGMVGRQAQTDLIPEAVIRPHLDLVIQRALHVVTASRLGTHRAQRKASRMVGVDQFVVNRRNVGKDAQPAKRIDLLEGPDRAFRNRLAACAMEAVTAGDEVTVDPLAHPILLEGDKWMIALKTGGRDIHRVIDRHAAVALAPFDQIARQLGLTIDHHPLATGEIEEIDAMLAAIEGKGKTIMWQPLAMQALSHTGAVHKANRPFFEDTGADTGEDMVLANAIDDDVVDAGIGEKLTEQQARRARSDDDDLGSHAFLPQHIQFVFAQIWRRWVLSTMDVSRLLLHKSNMTKRKDRLKNLIPTYELYGEEDPAGSRFWVHCETIPSRSALHHWEIGVHRHESYFQILLVTGGSGDAIFDQEIARFEPVSIVTVPPGVGHGFRFSSDIDGYVFTFLASRLPVRPGEPNALGEFLSIPRVTRLLAEDQEATLILAHLQRVAEEWQGRLTGRTVLMETGLAASLVLMARYAAQGQTETEATDDNDRRVEAFSALLHREVRNHRPASFYADQLGITPTHLNRVLKAKTGFGTQELVARRLIEETQRELLFTPGSIKEVAFRLGFSDPAYFSRFFSRQTGTTPGNWREAEQRRLGSRQERSERLTER